MVTGQVSNERSNRQALVLRQFSTAAIDVFKSMCDLPASPGTPYMKPPMTPSIGISGILILRGEVQGVVVLTLEEGFGPRLIGRIAGSDFASVNSNVVDGVREICSIIAGKARSGLDADGLPCNADIPRVVVGRNHIAELANAERGTMVLPYSTELGKFDLELSIRFG